MSTCKNILNWLRQAKELNKNTKKDFIHLHNFFLIPFSHTF